MTARKRDHVAEEVRHKLGRILYEEAKDPRFQAVTVSRVELAKDMGSARVYFSTYLKDVDVEDLTAALNNAAGFFSQVLGRTLQARRTPRLQFYYDKGFDYADKLERILAGVEPPGE